MREPIDRRTGSADTRRRIVRAATDLCREIGHDKATVADIAGRLSMSPANVYRFFPSKLAIKDAVVGEVLNGTAGAAAEAARSDAPVLGRLAAILQVIAERNADLSARQRRLQDLVAVAVVEGWPVVLAYDDRIRDLVRSIIGAGQASGEVRTGSPMALTCCLLEAMDIHLNPSRPPVATLRPSFEEMFRFCTGALQHAPSLSRGAGLSHSRALPCGQP
ncbi:TetR/AcrR family transcriptional regulator [Bradyrhizobium sp. CNPSo 4010]|uniref:TetR/AcrR family transcriptional regulator n=1 Tax=Bradyrhizobium agreste TaxID=2751811 RepID=A0ABS0PUT7_9BRAD|nr:TetR/AcrR family transcriptional regulator [Bradyrhizobium agreste]MBH5400667.1 TetR/AcrR family transcriptional regulator [Bradyrhizobium agreste]